MQPFRINISQPILDDLQARLVNTRWPAEQPHAQDWQLGTNPTYLRELLGYWQHHFDWRQQEIKLNEFPRFQTTVEGTELRFIHARGRGPRPLPLLLNHGWPDSSWQFTKLIPLLTDPAAYGGQAQDAFDVVAPDLPGFGFSAPLPPVGAFTGLTASRLQQLMTARLGYDHYFVHGTDVGTLVTERLALDYASSLGGIHMTGVPFTRMFVPPTDPSAAEQEYLASSMQWLTQQATYVAMQAREPNTLAPGLRDSPAGLAAWLLDKFRAWSDSRGNIDRGGNIESRFTKEELLTNLTIYWVTDTIGSSFAPYYQTDQAPQGLGAPKIEVPTGFTNFAHDLLRAPREFAERFYTVHWWAEIPTGGHFPALEEPQALAESIRAFFRPLR